MVAIPGGNGWRWEFVDGLVKKHNWTMGGEIGVKEGRFSYFLLSNNPYLTMISIDPWEAQPNNTGNLAETYADWNHEQYFTNFTEATKKFGYRSIIFRDYSFNVVKNILDESLDFIFIDGLHTYEAVKQDIIDWYPKIKPTGAIIGHDYNWPTVIDAIKDSIGLDHVMPGWNNCWYIWKKDIKEVKK